MPFLLDTNAWVRYIRDPNSPIRSRLSVIPVADVRMCSVVLAELYRGALRSADPTGNRAIIDTLSAPYQSFPFDDAAAHEYAQVRVYIERQGLMIGHFDLMIAAIALVHDLTVVTHNTGEFSRVRGIKLEDWEVP